MCAFQISQSRRKYHFARSEKIHEVWIPAIEKAYAKLYGSYGAISGGDIAEALRDLTGFPVLDLKLDHGDAKEEAKGTLDNFLSRRPLNL